MNVTKQQIQRGLTSYIENEVVKAISDKPVMMVAAVLAAMVKNNDGVISKILENPIVSAMLERSGDTYNLDSLFSAVNDTIQQYGNFELRVPLIRQPFVFNAEDFRKLKSYIEEV